MTKAALISVDAAVEALAAAAFAEPVAEDRYIAAVEAVQKLADEAEAVAGCVADPIDNLVSPGDIRRAISDAIGTPRMIIHCFIGSFGADWDLDGAVRLIREAEKVGWAPNIFGHELAALKDGKFYAFDVRAPRTGGDGDE
jgi:hypothetical protein